MMLLFQRLRRDEEGQTLVLGAIFGLILALCVLGTINLGRAVYEKTQVQTACDNGAYSQAAIEARTLNFTAYTNRAMVVHYASIMAATSYLTWLHFVYVFVNVAFTVLSFIPYIGQIFSAINNVFRVIMQVMDWALALMTPIISAANTVLYALQEGAWYSVWTNRLSRIPPEAHSGDSNADPYVPIWPALFPAANMAVFSQTRGHVLMPQNTADSVKILINSNNDTVQQARLHMVEVANSARTPWIAYGDRYPNPSGSPAGRHWAWSFRLICRFSMGTVARTELGTYAPGGPLGGITTMFGQVYSGSRVQVGANCPILGSTTISLFGMSSLDQAFNLTKNTIYSGPSTSGGALAKLIAKALGSVFNGLVNFANSNSKVNPDLRIFWISPYVFFSPRAAARPNGGLTSPLGNFGQPDVIFGLAREGRDYNRQAGAADLFGRRFSVNLGGGAGVTDFSYRAEDWPRMPGMPSGLQFLHRGFNALCAAQVYYHRPGEWREMPNFFNPLWGARLMPVMESNAFASMKLNRVPLFGQYLLH